MGKPIPIRRRIDARTIRKLQLSLLKNFPPDEERTIEDYYTALHKWARKQRVTIHWSDMIRILSAVASRRQIYDFYYDWRIGPTESPNESDDWIKSLAPIDFHISSDYYGHYITEPPDPNFNEIYAIHNHPYFTFFNRPGTPITPTPRFVVDLTGYPAPAPPPPSPNLVNLWTSDFGDEVIDL